MIELELYSNVIFTTSYGHCERGAVKRNELAVENFFPQSYGKSKHCSISEIVELFSELLIEKKLFLSDNKINIRDEQA